MKSISEKKYKLTEESISFNGKTLYRIEAVIDFGNVKKGQKGGFVETESNLSHDGNAWVSDNADVFGDAKVYGNANVFDNAMVYGNALVNGNACVSENVSVYDNALHSFTI